VLLKMIFWVSFNYALCYLWICLYFN